MKTNLCPSLVHIFTLNLPVNVLYSNVYQRIILNCGTSIGFYHSVWEVCVVNCDSQFYMHVKFTSQLLYLITCSQVFSFMYCNWLSDVGLYLR